MTPPEPSAISSSSRQALNACSASPAASMISTWAGSSPARSPRLPRLVERLAPGAVQLHDPGAMPQAASGEGHDAWLLFAPPCQGGGPLLGIAERVDLLAAVDHAAIDQPRDDRRAFPGRDRD